MMKNRKKDRHLCPSYNLPPTNPNSHKKKITPIMKMSVNIYSLSLVGVHRNWKLLWSLWQIPRLSQNKKSMVTSFFNKVVSACCRPALITSGRKEEKRINGKRYVKIVKISICMIAI